MAEDMITLRNKQTGEVIQVPRSKYVMGSENKGFSGIGEDIAESARNFPAAAMNMIPQIAKGASGAAKNIFTHPLKSALNVGAGVGEGAIALGNLPGNIMDYLARKGLVSQESADRTLHIPDLGIEKRLGIDKGDEGDQFIKTISSFLIPGKAAKALLPGKAAVPAALAATAAGENQDPLQAAILGILGKKAFGMIGKTPEAIRAIPKLPANAGTALGTALQNSADYVSAIPAVGKVIAPVAQPVLGMAGTKLKYASVTPETLAKEHLFGDITPHDLPEMERRNAAAKRMGFTPTLAELSQDAYEAAKQGEIGKTKEGQKALYKAGEVSDAQQEKAINELFDMIHENKLDPVKKAAYEDTMMREVPQEFIDKHIQNPAIQKAMNLVKNNTAFKQLLYDEYGVSDVDEVPKNTIMYWDFVKRALQDIESKSGRKGGKTEPAVFSRIRNRMVEDLDKIAPRYKEARNIAERGFTRNDLEKVFDKKAKTFNNFDSYLKSKENFDELTRKLQPFPEALQRLNDIKEFSGKVIPNNPGVRAAAALKRTSMSEPRNYLAAKHLRQLQKYGENHDVAQVNLMTHPDLMEYLKKYLSEKGKL